MSLVAPTRAVLGGLQGVLEKAEPGCELLPSLREEWWDETSHTLGQEGVGHSPGEGHTCPSSRGLAMASRVPLIHPRSSTV